MNMREEINELDLGQVNGGKVFLNEQRNMCGFNTLGEKYTLKVEFAKARNLLFQLAGQYPDMGEKEFDTLVRNEYKSRGWI